MDTKVINLDDNAKNSSVSSMRIFESEEFGEIRVSGTSDNPLFCLADICRVLEIKNVSDCKSRLKQEGIVLTEGVSKTTNQYGVTTEQKVMLTFVNEQNLYRVIMRSDKPQAEPFQDWVCGEVLPSIRKTGRYEIRREPVPTMTKEEYDLRMKEVSMKEVEMLERLRNRVQIPEFQSIADHYIMEKLTGNGNALPLPEVQKKTYSATEIGNMLGVSSNKIGRIAKEHNLKTEEYGKWFFDKSKYSNKEVETFRYYENAIDIFKSFL